MVLNRQEGNPLSQLRPLLTRQELTDLQQTVENTFVSDPVVQYIVDLIAATRESDRLLRGASPRATMALTAMAKSVARLRGRDYVVPGDVREVFALTLSHRLVLAPGGGETSPEEILRAILEATPTPRLR